MSKGIWIKERDWGSLLLSCPLGHSHTGWSWDRVGEGMQGAYCQLLLVGGWGTFPRFLSDWFKAVAEVGHSHAIRPQPWLLKHLRVGIPPVGCIFMPSIMPRTALPLISTYGNPCPMASRWAAVWGGLSKAGLAIVGAGVAGSTPVCTSCPTASLPGAA